MRFHLTKSSGGTLGVRSSTYNGYQWDEIMSAMSDVFTYRCIITNDRDSEEKCVIETYNSSNIILCNVLSKSLQAIIYLS